MNDRIVRISVDDGSVTGELPVDGMPAGHPLASGDTLVVLLAAGPGARDVPAVDAALHGERWRRSGEDEWTTVRPYLWHGKVLAGTAAGRLHAFALDDGADAWQMELEGRLRSLGSAGDRLYVGTIDGTLHARETVEERARGLRVRAPLMQTKPLGLKNCAIYRHFVPSRPRSCYRLRD